MKPFSICCVLAFIAFSSTLARIGDTFSQCKSRYGQPVSPGFGYYALRKSKDGWVLFRFKDVYIYVKCYDDKKVGRILYDTEPTGAVNRVDPKEFLALNSGNSEWIAVDGKPHDFETKDGRLRADLGVTTIEIWTLASEQAEQAAKDDKNKDRLEGF
jgi:hypothetical protein